MKVFSDYEMFKLLFLERREYSDLVDLEDSSS